MTQKDECRRKFNNVEILETYFGENEYPFIEEELIKMIRHQMIYV